MRRFLISLALSVSIASPAVAEGAFTGFYGGIGAGLGFNQEIFDNHSRTTGGAADPLPPHDAAALNLLGGYTMERGNWIVGGEVELSFALVDFTETDCDQPVAAGCADVGLLGTRDTAVRLRAIAGQAVSPSTFVFATAGITAAHINVDGIFAAAATAGGPVPPFTILAINESGTALGYNVGVGAEHRLSERFSIRGDVSFERLRIDTAINFNGTVIAGTSIANLRERSGNMGFEAVNFGLTALFRF